MYDLNDFVYIGRIVKTSAFKGQLIIRLNQILNINFKKEPVFLNIDGKLVPFFIDTYQSRPNSEALIFFNEIESWEDAKKLCNLDVYLPLNIVDSNKSKSLPEAKFLVGYQVCQADNQIIGIVKEYLQRKFQDLIVIDKNGIEYLLPWHQDLIVNIDHHNKKIIIEPPEGIFEISNSSNIV